MLPCNLFDSMLPNVSGALLDTVDFERFQCVGFRHKLKRYYFVLCDCFHLDIDECAKSDNECKGPYIKSCVNTPGSYTCQCREPLEFTDGKCQGNLEEITSVTY